jgi:hypothetical protein
MRDKNMNSLGRNITRAKKLQFKAGIVYYQKRLDNRGVSKYIPILVALHQKLREANETAIN